jgi:hypothetical protein
MRIPFSNLFEINLNGAIAPKREMRFHGHVLKPGHSLKLGQGLGDLNISAYLGKDLEVKEQEDAMVIVGFYA